MITKMKISALEFDTERIEMFFTGRDDKKSREARDLVIRMRRLLRDMSKACVDNVFKGFGKSDG